MPSTMATSAGAPSSPPTEQTAPAPTRARELAGGTLVTLAHRRVVSAAFPVESPERLFSPWQSRSLREPGCVRSRDWPSTEQARPADRAAIALAERWARAKPDPDVGGRPARWAPCQPGFEPAG